MPTGKKELFLFYQIHSVMFPSVIRLKFLPEVIAGLHSAVMSANPIKTGLNHNHFEQFVNE